MALKLPQGFFFRNGNLDEEKKGDSSRKQDFLPSLKLVTDKEIYRPGDSVIATIEIGSLRNIANETPPLLVDNLGFEIKGIEKLDTQWFSTQKPLPGSKQRRGETLFLDCSAPSIVSKVILPSGGTKSYTVRAELPKNLPPSYRGTTIRYFYYVRAIFYGRWLVLENGHRDRLPKDNLIQLEARIPLQIWVTQKNINLLNEGTVPVELGQIDIYWKEKGAHSEWTKVNEISDGLEEGYESSRDDPDRESPSSHKKLNHASSSLSPTLQRKISGSSSNDKEASSVLAPVEPISSEGFIRGRSYNIRIDDQVLLRFSPRNSDSSYYFGDMIGGTLTFFHGEGARRCLEVSVTLETSEIINQRFVHPSRRSSLAITKVQSDHHEVVADLMQTSFLFSIPVDGPMSFSTPYISVQWALRFEFFTTPVRVDLTRYEHPLLVEEREKGDWVLPITVYAPPPRPQAAHMKSENLSVGSLWVRT